ncbi:MAG: hypothetical protein QXO54_00135 [Candidatus Methanomethylicaceae archaeon]|nr:hypothetical protein [Candidatus Verstraetearchaeota archaeon]
MKVKHVTDRAIFWSVGRGEGEEIIGVEVCLGGEDKVFRRIVARGKYGKERTVFSERYSVDEFQGVIRSELALISSIQGVKGDALTLVLEAIELLRRVCEKL